MEASSVYFSSCSTGGAVSNNNRTSSVLQPSVGLQCCRRPFQYINYKTPHVHLYYYSKTLHGSNSTNYNLPLGQAPAANRRHGFGLAVGCAKWSEVKQSKEEEEEEEEEEEKIMMELDKCVREKCEKKKDVHGGGDGELRRKEVAELLECLEREAIMGEDQGRRPADYYARSLIFDRSSRVFQHQRQHQDRHPNSP